MSREAAAIEKEPSRKAQVRQSTEWASNESTHRKQPTTHSLPFSLSLRFLFSNGSLILYCRTISQRPRNGKDEKKIHRIIPRRDMGTQFRACLV